MRKNNRKGFTIVELVIVIAVIAILAGVLIPTFAGVVKNANESAVKQEARNAYAQYLANNADSGEDLEEDFIYIDAEAKMYVAIVNGSLQETVYESEKEAVAAANFGKNYSVIEYDEENNTANLTAHVCADNLDADGETGNDAKCDICGEDMPAEESGDDADASEGEQN